VKSTVQDGEVIVDLSAFGNAAATVHKS